MSYSTDDEGLMAELARALEQVTAVPPNRRLAARGSFTWRTVDEELLALTHDSLELADAAVRGDVAVRTLGFESDGLSLQVEFEGDQVFGQVLPPGTVARSTPSSSSRSRRAPAPVPWTPRGSSRWSPRSARSGSG